MDLVSLVVVALLVGLTTSKLARGENLPAWLLKYSLLIHIGATLFYMSAPGDWIGYLSRGYQNAKFRTSFGYVAPGTGFIDGICHFLQLTGEASTPVAFFTFSLLGFLGHVYFIAACRPYLRFAEDEYWPWIFLLPGLHVWTCAIGKDSLIFLPLCYTLYAASRQKVNDPLLFASVFLIFMIRPHIAICVIIAWVLASTLASDRKHQKYKAAKIVVGLVAFGIALPGTQLFLKVDEITVEGTMQQLDHMATYNQHGGGSVALDTLSPPLRLLTFMFRPLFFDIQNLLGWPASLENLLLLYLFWWCLRRGILKWMFAKPRFDIMFAAAFTVGVWFLLGMAIANLGLALRQKTMVLPFLFYVVFAFRHSTLPRSRKRKKRKQAPAKLNPLPKPGLGMPQPQF